MRCKYAATAPGQAELFDFADNGLPVQNRALMKTVDHINLRFPKALLLLRPTSIKSGNPE
ncbi:hypothetical protein A1359_15850 [Methylomonas lenta]|uniref:Uncharacterized protein n=1 Tax=Methylomonas lenta TaxID=980561 RepID=A0A177MYK8_9GAMM|nr:hypothetical protein A1359_15850 [Methylomonas lenta]